MDRCLLRRGAGFAAAGILMAYGAFAGPPASAAPGDAACAALAGQMRALAAPRIDDTIDQYYESGPSYAESDEQLSGLGLGNDESEAPAAPPDPDAALPAVLDEPVGANAAGTNAIERGVDEPDVVKVDGTRLLRLWGLLPAGADAAGPPPEMDEWQLSVLDAGADRPRLLGSVAPSARHAAHEMLLLGGHRVLVVGSVAEGSSRRGDRPDTAKVVLTLVDTADGARPTVIRTAKVTGRYVSARMADGVVRLVVATSAPIAVSGPVGPEPRAAVEARNRAALHRYTGKDWLPVREILDGDGNQVSAGPALACADVHRPVAPRSPDLLSVLTIDSAHGPDALDLAAASGLVGGGDVVYASPTRMYVAANGLDPADRDLQDAPAEVRDRLAVHAFDTSGRSRTPYVGSARMQGWLLGHTALSEHGGLLRVAVTTGQGSDRHSRIAVFEETSSSELREVGRVSGIGLGEDIRSVRWFGPLATVVTFRQKDPFYVVDLSRPATPRVLGALEIPGYSGYLHPVGAGRVLGVGQDADSQGVETDLQVSVFDVTDPARPRRSSNLVLGDGGSAVENDSRAFAYLPGSGIAVVPGWLYIYGPTGAANPVHFAGQPGHPVVVGVALDATGKLRQVGRFRAGAPVVRVVPMGNRLAAVTWSSVVMIDPRGMKPLGSVVVDGRYAVVR